MEDLSYIFFFFIEASATFKDVLQLKTAQLLQRQMMEFY